MYKKLIIILLIYSAPGYIFSHHTPGGLESLQQTQSRFVDPFTGKREKPNNYMIISYDLQKGAKDNKDIHTASLFSEIILGSGNFALNFSVPYLYYDQKDRKDATRIGKMYLGMKYVPFLDLNKNTILIFESRLGFPSGPDSDRFVGGDYYLGVGSMTMGYTWNQFAVLGKAQGSFPLSKIHPQNQNYDDGIPAWARTSYSNSNSVEKFELKKVTTFSLFLNYYYSSLLSFYGGFLYRTPFEGNEKTISTGDRIPLIFREASIGISYNFSENYFIGITYRRPLDRGKEFRLYESGYNVFVSMEF
jgi:hypothetical protein